MTLTLRRIGLGLATALLFTAACDDTVLQPTFGTGCRVGALSAGSDVTGTFNQPECVLDYHFWSGNTVRYVSYSVELSRGRGYHFYAASEPDSSGSVSGTRILTLYGKAENGQTVPLSVSATDAGGPNNAAEFFFIAPRSGTFNLVVSNSAFNNQGGYRVTMNECPVLGTIDTAGTYDYEMPTSPCIRRNIAYSGAPSRIALIGIKLQPGLTHSATLSSPAFSPIFEMGGPDFDVFGYIYDDSDFTYASGNGSNVALSVGPGADGLLTLAVGAGFLEPRGPFSVAFVRSGVTVMDAQAALPAAGRARRNLGLTRPVLR
jgi:hypothetical protein